LIGKVEWMTREFLGADGLLAGGVVEGLLDDRASIWCVWDLVDQLDLSMFERAFRADNSGGVPYDPRLIVTVVMACYQRGIRSPSRIAADCCDRLDLQVVLGGRTPSEATIRRWIGRHRQAWQRIETEVLRLCGEAGLVNVAVTATDGSPVAANAALTANRPLAHLDRRITGLRHDLADLARQREQATARLDAPGGIAAFVTEVCDDGRHHEQRLLDRLARLQTARAVAAARAAARARTREPDRVAKLQGWVDHHVHTLTQMIAAQRTKLATRAAREARGERVSGSRPTPVEAHHHIHRQWQALNAARAKLDTTLRAQQAP
jgi:transposase